MRFLIAFSVFFISCFALSNPKESKFDNRIAFASYNANDVFTIKAKNGFVSMLEFSKNERIVNIATGFTDGWELIERENFLFIKPKAYVIQESEQSMTDENGESIEFSGEYVIQPNSADWKTNLIVTTTKRIYVFDLFLDEEKINYKIEFLYPNEEKAFNDAKKFAEKKMRDELIEQNNIQKEVEKVNIPRNWDFLMHINKGSETIAPDFAYDDGVFTYLGFSSTKTIPSVFLYEEVAGKEKESILNTHIKKDGNYDVLTVHKTAQKILLRSGDKLVGIFNNGYAKNPLDKTYSTTKKGLNREILDGE